MSANPQFIFFFIVCYNLLGFIGLTACWMGFSNIVQADSLIVSYLDYTQILTIVLTVTFFLSSYLLILRRKEGYYIPVFLLTFFICGGFILLIPLLMLHLIYFTHPKTLILFS